jgi:hypothetical protein
MNQNKKKDWIYRFKPSWKEPSVTITGRDFNDLYAQVVQMFDVKGYSFNSDSLKNHILKQNNQTKAPKESGLTLGEVIKGGIAMLKFIKGDHASNREIQRRSKICQGCEDKSMVSDCMSCGGSRRVATAVNAEKAKHGNQIDIPAEIQKMYCKHCKCSLIVMIATKYKELKPESSSVIESRPNHCWLKPSSPNFTKE